MTKLIILLPAVFILGGLVGRFGPAEELRAYRQSAEEKAAKAPARVPNGFDSFAALANIPATASRPRRAAPARPAAAAKRPTNETVRASAATTPELATAEKPPKPVRLDPEDLRARIEEAAELWRTRVALKRAAVIENLGLDEAGVAAFDETLAGMNERLRETMQAMADQLAADGAEMTPELGVRLLGDLSTTVAETYDALGATVNEERRGEISRLMLHEFVDPSVAEPLIAVQGLLR